MVISYDRSPETKKLKSMPLNSLEWRPPWQLRSRSLQVAVEVQVGCNCPRPRPTSSTKDPNRQVQKRSPLRSIFMDSSACPDGGFCNLGCWSLSRRGQANITACQALAGALSLWPHGCPTRAHSPGQSCQICEVCKLGGKNRKQR